MVKILLLGAGGTAGYNFIKSLRLAEGYTIYGFDTNKYHALASEADFCFHTPTLENEKLEMIEKIIIDENINFIHAQPDKKVQFLSKFRDRFEGKIILPSMEALHKCADKYVTNNILNLSAIPVPKTISYIDYISSNSLDGEKLWIRPKRGAGSKASLPISSKDQAVQWVSYWKFRGLAQEEFIISEFLPGKEYAWQSLWYNGKLITCQARLRLEYIFSHLTPSGQSSSPSVSKTVNNEYLNEIGTRSILSLDEKPHGIYGIDCKEDANQQIKITEVNAGRFLSTTLFFAKAGLNFPDLYCTLIDKKTFPNLQKYNPLVGGLYWVRALDREPKIFNETDFKV